MDNEIATIRNRDEFQHIFETYFKNNEVFLRLTDGHVKARFLGYSEGKAAFSITELKSVAQECVLYVKIGATLIYAFLTYLEQEEAHLFIFAPKHFQIISPRSENRIELASNNKKKQLVYITNFISDFMMLNSLSMSQKKVEYIKDTILQDMDNAFQSVKIFLYNEGRSDPRMHYFNSERLPIYIPDFKAENYGKDAKKVNYFINHIYAKDILLKKNPHLISEISVPFLYHGKIPFGYIQINSATPLMKATLEQVKKFAITTHQLFQKHHIFEPSSEELIVGNITAHGFCVIVQDRKIIRYFKEDALMYLDMIFPNQEKSSILASVKYITTQQSHNIQIGFQIKDMDALSEVHYEQFLEELGQQQ